MISSNVIGDRSILGQFVCCILYLFIHTRPIDCKNQPTSFSIFVVRKMVGNAFRGTQNETQQNNTNITHTTPLDTRHKLQQADFMELY